MRHKDLQEILVTNRSAQLPGCQQKQPPVGGKPEKAHKYRVSPRDERTVDGIVFASKREMRAFLKLQMAEKAGAIHNLRRQVRFTWDVTYSANGQTYQKQESYIADFTWVEGGEAVTADAKGARLPAYIHKRKIMRLLFGIEIREL